MRKTRNEEGRVGNRKSEKKRERELEKKRLKSKKAQNLQLRRIISHAEINQRHSIKGR